jgi:class 3 adenylate cyclase
LVDYVMPEMNGIDFCKRVRDELKLEVPIILVSGNQSVFMDLARMSGVNDFVMKPFNRKDLITRTRQHIRDSENTPDRVVVSPDILLSNILPPHIVTRMQAGQTTFADRHDHVCILFSDIVGFTTICDHLPTTEVYGMLNKMFSAFDELTDKYAVYKVETVGDAYMVAAGHYESPDTAALGTPVYRMLQFATAMLQAVQGITTSDGENMRIRIGVNCGPAHSGVIGSKCPRYCFFGDTVNTASRMESNGVPSLIHVSAAVVDAYNNVAAFHCLGPRRIKGKGTMTTYLFVHDQEAVEEGLRWLDAQRYKEVPTRQCSFRTEAPTRRQSMHSEKAVAVPETLLPPNFRQIASEAMIDDDDALRLLNSGVGVRTLAFASIHDLEALGLHHIGTRLRIVKAMERIARSFLAYHASDG